MSNPVSTDAISAEILLLGDKWASAELQGDVATVKELLADDFHFVSTSGTLVSKSEWLNLIPRLKITKLDRSDIKVQIHHETAVLTGLVDLDSQSGGKTVKGTFRYGDVFSLREGRWQVIYSHFTPVTPREL